MSVNDKPIKPLIKAQFPTYMTDNNSLLVDITQSYYEWKDDAPKGTYSLLKKYARLTDIEDSGMEFFNYFKQHYLAFKDFSTDSADIYESIDDDDIKLAYTENRVFLAVRLAPIFYRTKGTEDSIRFLFRLLYQETPTIRYPGDDIIRWSGGNWFTKTIIKTEDAKFTEGVVTDISSGDRIYSSNDNAFAIVESVSTIQKDNRQYYEIKISNVKGTFGINSTITTITSEGVATSPPVSFTPLAQVTGATITNAGSGYTTSSGFSFDDSYYGLSGGVSNVSIPEKTPSGAIKGISINNSGIVDDVNNPPQMDFTAEGDGLATAEVILGGQFTTRGTYANKRSLLDSPQGIIEGGLKYNPFSYVINSSISFSQYVDVIKSLVHPVGTIVSGEINFFSGPQAVYNPVETHTFAGEIVLRITPKLYEESFAQIDNVTIHAVNSFIETPDTPLSTPTWAKGEVLTNQSDGTSTIVVDYFDADSKKTFFDPSTLSGVFNIGDVVTGSINGVSGTISCVVNEDEASFVDLWERNLIPETLPSYISGIVSGLELFSQYASFSAEYSTDTYELKDKTTIPLGGLGFDVDGYNNDYPTPYDPAGTSSATILADYEGYTFFTQDVATALAVTASSGLDGVPTEDYINDYPTPYNPAGTSSATILADYEGYTFFTQDVATALGVTPSSGLDGVPTEDYINDYPTPSVIDSTQGATIVTDYAGNSYFTQTREAAYAQRGSSGLSAPSYRNKVLAKAPIAYYEFQLEGEYTGSYKDSSGNAKHLDSITGTINTTTPHMVKNAYDGAGGLQIGATSEVRNGTAFAESINPRDFTVEFWVNAPHFGPDDIQFVNVYNTTVLPLMSVGISVAGNLELKYTWSGTLVTASFGANPLVAGKTHHIVAVSNDTTDTHKIYVDGVEVNSVSWSSQPPETQNMNYIKIGDSSATWDSPAFVSNYAVYNSALTGDEIADHYGAGAGDYVSAILADSPTAYWTMNGWENDTGIETDLVTGTRTLDYTGAVIRPNAPLLPIASGSNSCAYFDGITDWATSITNPVGSNGDMSVSMWWKSDDHTPTDRPLFYIGGDRGSDTAAENIVMYAIVRGDGSGIEIGHEYGAGTNQIAVVSATILENVPYFFTFTRDATAKQYVIYVNGVSIGTYDYTTNTDSSTHTSDIWIAATENGGNVARHRGFVSDVAVWKDVVLTAEQIDNHWKAAWGGVVPVDPIQDILVDTPAAFWSLSQRNDNTGTEVVDLSGNGRSLTETGTITLHQYGLSRWGGYAIQQGKQDTNYLSRANNDIALNGDMTVEFKFALADLTDYQSLFFIGGDGNSEAQVENHFMYIRWQSTGGFSVGHEYGTGNNEAIVWTTGDLNVTIEVGTSYHFALTLDYSGKNLEVFIDGVSQGVKAYTNQRSNETGAQLHVGKSYDTANPTYPLDGRIADVVVYHSKLSTDRILAHATNQAMTYDVSTLSLGATPQTSHPEYEQDVIVDSPILYWRFDETTGTTITDYSGLDHHGTVVGAPTVDGAPVLLQHGNSAFEILDNTGYAFLSNAVKLIELYHMSVEFWLRPKSIAAAVEEHPIVFIGGSNASSVEAENTNFYIAYETQSVNMSNNDGFAITHEYGAGNSETVYFQYQLTNNTTYHIVATRNIWTMEYEIFIDGISIGTVPYVNAPTGGSSGSVYVGRKEVETVNTNFVIDEFAIYRHVLSSTRASYHYSVGGISATISESVHKATNPNIYLPLVVDYNDLGSNEVAATPVGGMSFKNFGLTLNQGASKRNSAYSDNSGTGNITFDGTEPYQAMSSTEATVSFWMRMDAWPDENATDFISFGGEHPADNPFMMVRFVKDVGTGPSFDSGSMDIDCWNGSTFDTFSMALPIGSDIDKPATRFHVAIIRQESTGQLRTFFNGEAVNLFSLGNGGSIPMAGRGNKTLLLGGANRVMMNDFGAWDRVLTSQEILSLYTSGMDFANTDSFYPYGVNEIYGNSAGGNTGTGYTFNTRESVTFPPGGLDNRTIVASDAADHIYPAYTEITFVKARDPGDDSFIGNAVEMGMYMVHQHDTNATGVVYWEFWSQGDYNERMGSGTSTTSSSDSMFILAEGDVVMLAYSARTGRFWIGKNGTWFNSGVPEGHGNVSFPRGTTPTATNNLLDQLLVPKVNALHGFAETEVKMNFGFTDSFVYDIPPGFNVNSVTAQSNWSSTISNTGVHGQTDLTNSGYTYSPPARAAGDTRSSHLAGELKGKRYIELHDVTYVNSNHQGIWLSPHDRARTTVGSYRWDWGNGRIECWRYDNNSNVNIADLPTQSSNIDIMIAVDTETGEVWYGVDGTWLAGDPAAGTGATYNNEAVIPAELGWHLCIQSYETSACSVTVCVGDGLEEFRYTVPTGFNENL